MFVTASMSRGGAERVISILSDYYVNQGWDVDILVLFKGTEGYSLNPKVKLIDRTSRLPSRIRLISCIFKLRKEIKYQKPDIVLSFLDSICLISGFACKGLNTKLICCERIDPSATKRLLIFRKLINKIYGNCDKTVVQTRRAYNYFPSQVQKNCVIIPNPVNVKTYATEPVKKFVTAGRLTAQKNHKMLIEAFSQVVKKHSDWSLYIYGDGELKNALTAQIQALGLENSVHLMGNSPDLHKEIADAGAFVLSSNYEGLSNALLEAMQMGLCCISTNCAGSDEAIQSGQNGIIVPIKDVQALANAMLYVAENPDVAKKIASEAKQSSIYYASDNVLCKWKNLIENVKVEL